MYDILLEKLKTIIVEPESRQKSLNPLTAEAQQVHIPSVKCLFQFRSSLIIH